MLTSRKDFYDYLISNTSYANWTKNYLSLIEEETITEEQFQRYFSSHCNLNPASFISSFEEIISLFFKEEELSDWLTTEVSSEKDLLSMLNYLLESGQLDRFLLSFRDLSILFLYLNFLIKQKNNSSILSI